MNENFRIPGNPTKTTLTSYRLPDRSSLRKVYVRNGRLDWIRTSALAVSPHSHDVCLVGSRVLHLATSHKRAM